MLGAALGDCEGLLLDGAAIRVVGRGVGSGVGFLVGTGVGGNMGCEVGIG